MSFLTRSWFLIACMTSLHPPGEQTQLLVQGTGRGVPATHILSLLIDNKVISTRGRSGERLPGALGRHILIGRSQQFLIELLRNFLPHPSNSPSFAGDGLQDDGKVIRDHGGRVIEALALRADIKRVAEPPSNETKHLLVGSPARTE